VLNEILENLIQSVDGARAVIFLDGEGEAIAQGGDATLDIKMVGAWKEIHLDQIRDIAGRLKLGSVQAVLFSHDQGNELVVPVAEDYCLLLYLSSFANIQDATSKLKGTIAALIEDIS
jgi:predicted regulator of Ras-like GTPase activity (Roadblock/LC7/MglB family)